MQTRNLGTSDVKVTPLAFGAWAIGGQMWGGAEEGLAIKAVRASFDAGITTIDTAPVYGFGRSEELVARGLEGIPRDKYQLLTKFGLNWNTKQGEFNFAATDDQGNAIQVYKYAGKSEVIKECEESLRRLKTDYIDLLQIHWPDPTTPIAETMEAMAQLIRDGKIRAAGVCNYSAEQVAEAVKTIRLASNQVPYSMLYRKIEKDVIPQAVELKMSILPYSPLQRGLLTGKIKPGHVFNEGDTRKESRFFKDESIRIANDLLEKLRPLAEKYNASLSQLVINWTSRQPAMDCVLVGARDDRQVMENVRSLDFTISDEDLKQIRSYVDPIPVIT